MSNKITADFSKTAGKIKPLHGVNNGPVTRNFMYDATDEFRSAGIPYSRLHDTEGSYGLGEYIDVPAIFKNFDADVNDENNYNFTCSDAYIKCILDAGTKVIYRLGVTIENGPIKRYIYPPKDNKKWAQICEHIIMHYNEGWADGYHYNIEYWEIWNEPNFFNHMWLGTDEEFFDLYKTASIHLKNRFPHLKFGGPGMGYSFDEYTPKFFDYMTTGERCPIDFFSWHYYFLNAEEAGNLAREADEYLKKYGYTETENLCTEWNYVENWKDFERSKSYIHGIEGAAMAGAVLCEFQKSPMDIATYYDAQINGGFNGLLGPGYMKSHDVARGVTLKKTYHVFYAFNKLYQLGTEIETAINADDTFVIGAKGDKEAAVFVSRFDKVTKTDKAFALEVSGIDCKSVTAYRIDRENDYTEICDVDLSNITLSDYSAMLFIFEL